MRKFWPLVLIMFLGGDHGLRAMVSRDKLSLEQPRKVSHRNSIVLGNGQFHDMWVSIGRPKSGIQARDNFKLLASAYDKIGPLHDNIYFFDKKRLFDGQVDETFWAYVNSPTSRGGLAQRPGMDGRGLKWPDLYSRFKGEPPWRLFNSGNISQMSAAEKYDYLLGSEIRLFSNQVRYSNQIYNRDGKIPYWAGICHGTAPASFSYPEPLRTVNVKAYNGSTISFSPADIKRLAAHAWGENNKRYTTVGGRCNLNELGSREQNCLDNNPATFHLSILNYIGLYKKTFIIDNAYNADVWNRPVMGFSFKYRNPKTKVPSRQLKYSMIALSDFPEDPNSHNRHHSAHYLVGVEMKVKLLYGDEGDFLFPSTAGYDIHYKYDLEIDRQGKIVGGEWETLYHPDFIWMVKENTPPKTSEDFFIKESLWNGQQPLKLRVRQLGNQAAKRGQVLEFLVRSLVELSRKQRSE
ncbi:MAG: hypothetical protein KC478_09305 [Bacteriovoracaceae bacterium]|nr:hypothetical protein [Bacteriovoracaceae bacterium]